MNRKLKTENRSAVEHEGGIAILYRTEGESKTERCPFCKINGHIHSLGGGHVYAHCTETIVITAADGTQISNDRGYIIRERKRSVAC